MTKRITRKLTSTELRKIINETSQKRAEVSRTIPSLSSILFEKADPSKLNPDMPLPLSQVDAAAAKIQVAGGADSVDGGSGDDVIGIEPKPDGIATVQALKPSQSSMNIAKALTFVMHMIDHPAGKMDPGGDLGAFISKDGYIMDGHHRWIATAMVDPTKQVGGNLVDFPGEQLVPVLNALTKGKYNKTGKPASGGFDQFKAGPIAAQLAKFVEGGISAETAGDVFKGWQAMDAEGVQAGLEAFTQKEGEEAVEAAVKQFVGNLSGLTMSTPEWAPERPDMPVIDEEDSADAVAAITGGEVDVNPPFAKAGAEVEEEVETEEVETEEKTKVEGTSRKDGLIMERWRKLAGLL